MSCLIIAGFSCNKKELVDVDSIVFGTSYGFCIGDCASFFKIQEGSIYPDVITRPGSINFSSTPLATDKYLLAKELKENFPQYLLDHPNKTFGCPDCADQGSIYIEINNNGNTKYWYIDTDVNKQPDEIKIYIKKLREILTQL